VVQVADQQQGERMLTTIDNPWNPFTHWAEWYAYDTSMGYNTVNFFARIAQFSFDLSDADQDRVLNEAIDEIVRENVRGIYKVATQPMTSSQDLSTQG